MTIKHAELSEDERYRWLLERRVGDRGITAMWIGVNPSIADAILDDHSIRKLYGFGKNLVVGELGVTVQTWLVGNLFAYRATNVKELSLVEDPVGPDCDAYLQEMIQRADLVIAGWGRIDKVPFRLRYRADQVASLVSDQGKMIWCWGTGPDGHPRHPLMLPYSTPLEVWR